VIVAEPGHVPWMTHAAAALARTEMLSAYISPLGNTVSEAKRLTGPLPGPLASRVLGELQRRRTPSSIPASAVKRVATVPELACVAARRVRPAGSVARALADRRDRAFDRGVSRRLGPEHDAAYVAFGSALEVIRKARRIGVSTALQHTVHHHRFAESILQDELARQPDWAPTMQFHRPSPRRKALIEAEVEAADRIMVLSSFSKDTFVDAGVEEDKIVVTPPGVDLDRYSPTPRADQSVFRVLFVGVLSQRKGLSYLLEGFRRAGLPTSELLLVGEPWGGAAPWADQAGVRVVRWLRNRDLPGVYRSADVFVLPSLVEGFGRVILEAMASGLPVIATPHSGAGDAVRDGVDGHLVPIRDPEAIAERLAGLHGDDAARARMGARARERAEQFTWERYGARLVEVLGEGCG
jgi:starch synthase